MIRLIAAWIIATPVSGRRSSSRASRRERGNQAEVRSMTGRWQRHRPRDDLEALGLLLQPVAPELPITVFGHFHAPATRFREPAGEGAGVGAVAPDQPQPRQAVLPGASHQRLRAEAVVPVGGVHVGKQHEAGGVHEEVPFAAGGALGGIVAASGTADTAARTLDRSAIKGCPRWQRSARRCALPREGTRAIVQAADGTITPPTSELGVDRRPGWEMPRLQPPRAAGAHEVEDRLGQRPRVYA
jgi:hypothetical protein